MASAQEVVKGYLIVNIEEASGKTSRDHFTWDTNIGSPFETFVKVELRGATRNVKAQTKKAPLVGETVTWREEMRLEVLEGCNELRLMLCREKFQGNKRGTSVIAACGIFVSDILEAVPIDRYFELFKPNAGGEGGLIRIRLNFISNLGELPAKPAAPPAAPAAKAPPSLPQVNAVAAAGTSAGEVQRRRGAARLLVPLLVVAAGVITGVVLQKRREEPKRSKEEPTRSK